MRERAVVSVLALTRSVDVGSTEFCLVLIWMIELLHPVVRFLAFLSFRAFPSTRYVLTHFRLIGPKGPPLILLLVMVERTSLQVVTV